MWNFLKRYPLGWVALAPITTKCLVLHTLYGQLQISMNFKHIFLLGRDLQSPHLTRNLGRDLFLQTSNRHEEKSALREQDKHGYSGSPLRGQAHNPETFQLGSLPLKELYTRKPLSAPT